MYVQLGQATDYIPNIIITFLVKYLEKIVKKEHLWIGVYLNNLVEKIAIGTVQFGLNYGINNTNGIPSEADIDNLLRFIFD